MTNELEKNLKEINSKLSVLISLQLLKENFSVKEKVAILVRAGVDNQSISKILGISEKHVSKEKSLMKRGIEQK